MVYEARAGQTFMLGVDLAHRGDHPRPGAGLTGAGRPWGDPVLEGRGPRPALRARRGDRQGLASSRRWRREGARRSDYPRRPGRAQPAHVHPRAEVATGAVPSDRTVVVERFRDEIGDWRVCVLTPFGARCTRPGRWRLGSAAGVARRQRLRALVGRRHRAAFSGLGCASADRAAHPRPEELDDLVMAELAGTAPFGSRFRENAAAPS